MGAAKTLAKVRARFYWPGQKRDVEMWCKSCATCNSRKAPPGRARAPLETSIVQRPLQRVAMDTLGPLLETCHAYRAKIVLGGTIFATKIVPPGTILVAKSVPALPKVYRVVRKGR